MNLLDKILTLLIKICDMLDGMTISVKVKGNTIVIDKEVVETIKQLNKQKKDRK